MHFNHNFNHCARDYLPPGQKELPQLLQSHFEYFLTKTDKQLEQLKQIAHNFEGNLTHPVIETPKHLVEVHLTVNESIAYKFVYEDEDRKKITSNIKVINGTLMLFEGNDGVKRVIRQGLIHPKSHTANI